ncbi:Uncharacterised protein [Vibrio cholerae]|uniref:Uncharacterized protein n=1 Tax=Vibrio cholerae TaxID=666 RepID=A0A655PWE1_VIBCL|nr:Uncharacterised protein [Vibrio cholerae]CSA51599.1 Uncharacterised protein [Vibrio cholerae]
MTAIGTFFSGFSTASALAHADSKPKNAHNVIAIEPPNAWKNGKPCGFHAERYKSKSNQYQPMMDTPITGMMMPQTVTLETWPVIRAPPKLATVATHNTKIVAIQVSIGVR